MHRSVGIRGRRPWAALALGLSLLPAAALAQDAGFGTDIPLSLAVKQIVPDGYKVQIAPGVDASAPVSWKEGGGWKQAISGAAKGAGFTTTITNDTVRITRSGGAKVEVAESVEVPAAPVASGKASARRAAVERARHAPPARVSERPRRERVVQTRRVRDVVVEEETVSGGGFVMVGPRVARETVEVVDAKGRAGGTKVAVAVAPRAEWIVREGENLQSVLRDWSGKEGWKMVWESEFRYQIASSAKFDGDFVQAASELVRSMSHIRPLVTVTFYQGNKTIVVGNGSTDAAGAL